MAKRTEVSAIERFFDKIEKVSSGCWEWRGASNVYGQFWLNGRVMGAHRASWIISFGEIPDDRDVCHRCDNPSCVRPSHLFVGTTQENMDDMVRKGRSTRGSNNPNSKLSEASALEIRHSTEPSKVLAERFEVSSALINMVRRGVIWKHINQQ